MTTVNVIATELNCITNTLRVLLVETACSYYVITFSSQVKIGSNWHVIY